MIIFIRAFGVTHVNMTHNHVLFVIISLSLDYSILAILIFR